MSVVKYSLMRRHRIFIQIPLALALLGVASRAEGCYFYLFLSLLARGTLSTPDWLCIIACIAGDG